MVEAWVAARNGGDSDAAMRLIGMPSNLFGVAIRTEADRTRFKAILDSQHEAGFQLEDQGCTADGPRVHCRYRETDGFMDRCGLALTGEHRYLVYDGKLTFADRRHDAAYQDAVYAAIDAFRAWIVATDPELEDVIWADTHFKFYTTVEGARAMLGALDRYPCESASVPPTGSR